MVRKWKWSLLVEYTGVWDFSSCVSASRGLQAWLLNKAYRAWDVVRLVPDVKGHNEAVVPVCSALKAPGT